MKDVRQQILDGETYLGVELGSTRIKAVLVDAAHRPVASGGYGWENRLENGIWTYDLDEVWTGLRACVADLLADVEKRYGVPLARPGAMGVSGMMHGYLAFDEAGELLAPFRTWRNTVTGEAAAELTALLDFNIPQRWSAAHLYQAILNGEAHVGKVARLFTLAAYIHWRLTGARVVGICEASGMFPIDAAAKDYDARMLARFDARAAEKGFHRPLRDVLPRVLTAGEPAGTLTETGARLLDPSGTLLPGVPLCPPEGDAGTGMAATDSVAARTGNVSAGTSIFLMAVLEKPLSRVHPEIDMVVTPSGDPVAMVHCNNCTGDLDAWIRLLAEGAALFGAKPDKDALYGELYRLALTGDADCGGLTAYNYLSGEHVTGFSEGRPLFIRRPESAFTLANFMRAHLYAAFAALKTGLGILLDEERVSLDGLTGHGGLFKVEGVAQRFMAAAANAPVTVMATAGEGGPWGMALLAAYMAKKADGETLPAYLEKRVFAGAARRTVAPDAADAAGFAAFMARYAAGLSVERAAVERL